MREIKFRAWNKNEKWFFYWDTSFAFGGTGKVWGDIEQYTGLVDKNGKEIYEGDIAMGIFQEIPREKYFKVVWNDIYTCFMGVNIYDDSHDIILTQWELEVIGNIHENPELIQ